MDVLTAGDVTATVDADLGATLVSLRVGDLELMGGTLSDEPPASLRRGSFPMAPFAGRIKDGRFGWGGGEVSLPIELGGHALHGMVKDRSWHQVGEGAYEVDLGAPWPVDGTASLAYDLTPERLVVRLAWRGKAESPVSLGLHPWFRRRLDRGAPAQVDVVAASEIPLDERGIPTGEVIAARNPVREGCVTGLEHNPVIRWPGAMRLELASDAAWWFLYDVEDYSLCVEPQTAPVDAANHPQWRVDATDLAMTATFTWHAEQE